MSQFASELRGLEECLDLPEPARARLLAEIATDLEDVYRAALDAGLEEPAARARALALVEPGADALTALAAVHGGFLRRLLDRLSEGTRGRMEGVALALVALITVQVGVGLAGQAAFAAAGAWAWPVVGAASAALLVAGGRFYALVAREDHGPSRLRRGLGALLALGALQLGAGLVGMYVGLIRVWRRTSGVTPADADAWLALHVEWLRSSAALLSLATTAFSLTAFTWYALSRRVAKIERAAASARLDP